MNIPMEIPDFKTIDENGIKRRYIYVMTVPLWDNFKNLQYAYIYKHISMGSNPVVFDFIDNEVQALFFDEHSMNCKVHFLREFPPGTIIPDRIAVERSIG